MSADMQCVLDAAALRRAAEQYGMGADRRDKALWRQVLADDCVIEGPGFRTDGLEAALASIDALGQMFRGTLHRIHQVVADIEGNTASGETYCTADHLLADQDMILVWSIRYQDAWRRGAEGWRFTRRKLILDWEEVRPVAVKGDTL